MSISKRATGTVAGAALLIGIGTGYVLDGSDEPESSRGMVVDGSDVARLLWEEDPRALAEPPRCEAASDDGIGLWRCRFRYVPPASAGQVVPEPPSGRRLSSRSGPILRKVVVTVDGDGGLEAKVGSNAYTACCVPVR